MASQSTISLLSSHGCFAVVLSVSLLRLNHARTTEAFGLQKQQIREPLCCLVEMASAGSSWW
jgi:hypothetical protein